MTDSFPMADALKAAPVGPLQLITFDLDDTLWDVRPALIKAEQAQNDWLLQHYPRLAPLLVPETLLQRKQTLAKTQPALRHNISLFRQTLLKQLMLELGLGDEEATQSAMAAFEAFLSKRNEVAIFESAPTVLALLAERYTLAALTNGNADVFQTPLGHYFSFALRAEDVGAAKPEPHMFHRALEKAGVTPGACLHVGDNHDHDIEGAARAGVASVWLAEPESTSDIANAIIHCLSELPALLDAWSITANDR